MSSSVHTTLGTGQEKGKSASARARLTSTRPGKSAFASAKRAAARAKRSLRKSLKPAAQMGLKRLSHAAWTGN